MYVNPHAVYKTIQIKPNLKLLFLGAEIILEDAVVKLYYLCSDFNDRSFRFFTFALALIF